MFSLFLFLVQTFSIANYTAEVGRTENSLPANNFVSTVTVLTLSQQKKPLRINRDENKADREGGDGGESTKQKEI